MCCACLAPAFLCRPGFLAAPHTAPSISFAPPLPLTLPTVSAPKTQLRVAVAAEKFRCRPPFCLPLLAVPPSQLSALFLPRSSHASFFPSRFFFLDSFSLFRLKSARLHLLFTADKESLCACSVLFLYCFICFSGAHIPQLLSFGLAAPSRPVIAARFGESLFYSNFTFIAIQSNVCRILSISVINRSPCWFTTVSCASTAGNAQ